MFKDVCKRGCCLVWRRGLGSFHVHASRLGALGRGHGLCTDPEASVALRHVGGVSGFEMTNKQPPTCHFCEPDRCIVICRVSRGNKHVPGPHKTVELFMHGKVKES